MGAVVEQPTSSEPSSQSFSVSQTHPLGIHVRPYLVELHSKFILVSHVLLAAAPITHQCMRG